MEKNQSDGWIMDMVLKNTRDGRRPLKELLPQGVRNKLYQSEICFVEDLLQLPESSIAKVPKITARDVRVIVGRLAKAGYHLPNDPIDKQVCCSGSARGTRAEHFTTPRRCHGPDTVNTV